MRYYKGGNDKFLRHWLFVNMPFTEEDTILINNSFDFKDYDSRHFVTELSSKGWNLGIVYHLLQKLRVGPTIVLAAADDAASAQLITLILLTNWC